MTKIVTSQKPFVMKTILVDNKKSFSLILVFIVITEIYYIFFLRVIIAMAFDCRTHVVARVYIIIIIIFEGEK